MVKTTIQGRLERCHKDCPDSMLYVHDDTGEVHLLTWLLEEHEGKRIRVTVEVLNG